MKNFGHVRVEHDISGKVIGTKYSPARARTRAMLGRNYGPDAGKRLVVSLDEGDLIALRPEKTKRPLVIQAVDLYAQLVRRQAAWAVQERRAKRKPKRKTA